MKSKDIDEIEQLKERMNHLKDVVGVNISSIETNVDNIRKAMV
jgi:hypothetical protein